MKNLLLFSIAFLFVFCSAFGQKTRFGITAGMSVANMYEKDDGGSMSADSKSGITFGFISDIKLSEKFSLQPALNFVQKGYNYKESDIGYTYSDKLTLNYLEIPVNVLFRPAMQQVQFFVGAGPSIAFALSGKEKENDNGVTDEYTYQFGNDEMDDDLKGIDFGANFLTGIELKNGLQFSINYNLGLSNLIPGSPSDYTLKNKYWGFKIGYVFAKRK